jgi:hypothetical protein
MGGLPQQNAKHAKRSSKAGPLLSNNFLCVLCFFAAISLFTARSDVAASSQIRAFRIARACSFFREYGFGHKEPPLLDVVFIFHLMHEVEVEIHAEPPQEVQKRRLAARPLKLKANRLMIWVDVSKLLEHCRQAIHGEG